MKTKIVNLIIGFIFLTSFLPLYGGSKNDVVLTVTSDGATKEEAVKNALREAVEQTYGVFVSGNTSIFNDELIGDEIATVSSGNIKKYKEVAYSHVGDNHTVTLTVTVSTGKLISYAKSKGAECELDGASMFADIQLQELYRNNEEKLFENLISELEGLFSQGYDYELEVKKQSEDDRYGFREMTSANNVNLECHITAKLNKQGEYAWKKLMETLKTVGQKYNSEWFFGVKKKDGFNHEVSVYTGSTLYNGSDCPSDIFLLRSPQSARLVRSLLDNIPCYIRNIRFDLNGEKVDIWDNLEDWKNNRSDQAMVLYNMVCPYRKSQGADCGQFLYVLQIPLENLKNIKNIKIESNN